MATLVRREARPGRGPVRSDHNRAQSVREICLLGTAPGEPGAGWRREHESVALEGREYRVEAVQRMDSGGGYVHLSVVGVERADH